MAEKKPNFFHWYYNEAVHDLLEIWKNFLVFAWGYFSVWELFKTLFYPWHRDLTFSNWRGFHPIRVLKMLIENMVSRVLGAIVRSFVVVFGIAVFSGVLVMGIIIDIFWISAPLLALAVLFLVAQGKLNLLVALAVIFIWISIVLNSYFNDTKESLLELENKKLLKHRVFARICARLGVARKRFPNEVFESEELFADFLKARNLSQEEYATLAAWELGRAEEKIAAAKFWRKENLAKISAIGRDWRFGFTVNLDRYATDLSHYDNSEYAHAELVGRSEEYDLLKLILTRPDQNCALLVAKAGVGKKTLLHELARRVRLHREENSLTNVRLLKLDLGRVISDTINRGEDTENFLRLLFVEAANAGNVILIIEHLEYFLGGEASALHPDISAVLSEFLHLPMLRIIAMSTPSEYHKLIEKQEHIAKYFEVIELREPNEDETILILLDQLEKYETRRVLFTFKALKAIVTASNRHNWQTPLPERAIDLAMGTVMFWEKKSDEQFITEKTVADYLSLKTGVAQGEIEGAERKKLLNLEATLHRQVIGQDEAIKQVSAALRRARSGLASSHKPIGSFLFLGPTGVGKTETAKALAKTYFGDEHKLIRLDMSEFQAPNSIDRLLGSSQLNQPGILVTKIKDNPYALLLLDEIEKAYPEILDLFLQILDEGFVTDAFGEKINFRNTMIIATSNAGAALIKKMVEQNSPAEEIKKAVIDHAIENNIFRTEFLNRFESVIFFRPLNDKELVSVVRLQLQKFARRLAKEKNIEIEYDDKIVSQIIAKGYNPIFGARSLNHFIEDQVESLVAQKIIAGEVAQGEKVVIGL